MFPELCCYYFVLISREISMPLLPQLLGNISTVHSPQMQRCEALRLKDKNFDEGFQDLSPISYFKLRLKCLACGFAPMVLLVSTRIESLADSWGYRAPGASPTLLIHKVMWEQLGGHGRILNKLGKLSFYQELSMCRAQSQML